MSERPALSTDFVQHDLIERLLAINIASTAVDLARQAGEEVKRPLSQAQLARAVRVNSAERDSLMDLLVSHYMRRHQQGRLPERAYWEGPERVGE